MKKTKGLMLITGAAKRIGRVSALYVAKEGWDVILHYHSSKNEAERTAQEIRVIGRKAFMVQADLSVVRDVENLIPAIKQQHGPLTALVNNASLFERDMFDPGGARHNQINFSAPCRLAECLRQQLPAELQGTVVNLVDAGPLPDVFDAYAKSKGQLEQATRTMAKDMAPRVRINAVSLGPTLINPRQSRDHFDRLVRKTPLGVEIPPEAVAASVLFLIENPVITGEILHVDGGAHLLRPES